LAAEEHYDEDFQRAKSKATNNQSGSIISDPSRKEAQKEQVASKSGRRKIN
jgi:hypothetical protein